MDAVGAYLDRIGEIPRITPDDERSLSALIANGGGGGPGAALEAAEALDQLVRSNLRLVVSIAKRYPTNSRVDISDLIQAGNQGLFRAAERFDGRKGYRFSTYATRWIRQSIGRMLDKTGSSAAMPIDTCLDVRSALRSAGGSPEALPSRLRALELAYNAASLDRVVEEGASTLGDLQADRGESTEAAVLRREECRVARAIVAKLLEPHRQAVCMRYGLDGQHEHTYREISEALGVPVAEVSNILRQAKVTLRASAESIR